jgi:hypothetical protein
MHLPDTNRVKIGESAKRDIKTMPRGKYVGKRINATVPVDMYKQIAEIAERENRSLSQQVVYFVGLALNEYNKENPPSCNLEG